MTFTPENIFFIGAVLIFASIVISKWGYRFGVPTLLLFLFTGMLFGSDGLGLEFNSHEDAQLIGMLSLSVILFSGGMDTKLLDILPLPPTLPRAFQGQGAPLMGRPARCSAYYLRPYPVIAGIEDAHFLFNVVFVITLLSLSLQGTTITACARWLGLATEEKKEGNEFGVELPEELGSRLSEMIVTDETLAAGNHLSDMHFPEGTLVMMIKRAGSIIVPNGKLELKKGDILLTITNVTTL